MRRVVITGMGALTPIGNNISEYWEGLKNGKNGVQEITKFDVSAFKTRFACEIKNFDPNSFIEKKFIKKYDAYTQYALVVVQEAIENAKIDFEKLDCNRVGVIWGSSEGGLETFDEQMTEFIKGNGTPNFNPYFIPKMLVNMAAGVISIKYGLKGINHTTATACASSNTAIIEAFNYIQWGKADMIITGGSEAGITRSNMGGFGAIKALSTNNENYKSASRPFDIHRDGFVMGEGAGAIILESYDSAIKRGVPILAEIIGGSMKGEAYHLTGTHPEGEGAYSAMLEAINEAGIQPSDIDYINAHATSTSIGDASEMRAIERLVSFTNKDINISGTKSMTGHLLGAAGVIESIASILAIQNSFVPPTINTNEIDPEFQNKLNFTLEKGVSKEIKYVLNNTFGFGGHIATSLFKKFED